MPIELPNLRSLRSPTYPWDVESPNFQVQVTQTDKTQRSDDFAHFSLSVDISTRHKNSKILKIESQNPGAKIIQQEINSDNKVSAASIKIEVEAPMLCEISNNREQISLVITYQEGKKIFSEIVDVDLRCLLGDVGEGAEEAEEAEEVAQLAQKYRSDPMVQRLVALARPFRTRYAFEEVKRVKEWLGYGEKVKYEGEPNAVVLGAEGEAYALSPTETARYGGDCEDWTILFGAYLAERGYHVQVAFYPGHVWNWVHGLPLDFLKDNAFAKDEAPSILFPTEIATIGD